MQLKPEQNTVILRNISNDTPVDTIQAIFSDVDGCPIPSSVRFDMNDTWFVSFTNEDEAKAALGFIANSKFNGKSVKARLKSESIIRSRFPSQTPNRRVPATGIVPAVGALSPSSLPPPPPPRFLGLPPTPPMFYPYLPGSYLPPAQAGGMGYPMPMVNPAPRIVIQQGPAGFTGFKQQFQGGQQQQQQQWNGTQGGGRGGRQSGRGGRGNNFQQNFQPGIVAQQGMMYPQQALMYPQVLMYPPGQMMPRPQLPLYPAPALPTQRDPLMSQQISMPVPVYTIPLQQQSMSDGERNMISTRSGGGTNDHNERGGRGKHARGGGTHRNSEGEELSSGDALGKKKTVGGVGDNNAHIGVGKGDAGRGSNSGRSNKTKGNDNAGGEDKKSPRKNQHPIGYSLENDFPALAEPEDGSVGLASIAPSHGTWVTFTTGKRDEVANIARANAVHVETEQPPPVTISLVPKQTQQVSTSVYESLEESIVFGSFTETPFEANITGLSGLSIHGSETSSISSQQISASVPVVELSGADSVVEPTLNSINDTSKSVWGGKRSSFADIVKKKTPAAK